MTPQALDQIRQRAKDTVRVCTRYALTAADVDREVLLAEVERLQGLLDQQTQELERFRLQQRIVVETGSQFGPKVLSAAEERETP